MGNDLSTPRPWFPGLKPGKLKETFFKVLYAMRNFYRIRFHCLCNFSFQVTVGHYVQCVGFKPKELVKHRWSNWMRQTKRPWLLYPADFWNNMMIDICHKLLPFLINHHKINGSWSWNEINKLNYHFPVLSLILIFKFSRAKPMSKFNTQKQKHYKNYVYNFIL